MLPAFMAVGVSAVEDAEGFMQQTMLKLRYASVPVVSAIRGMALGGGCELAVYSHRRVAAMESYIGLVEVGVGLVPGAGGLTYIARRAAENAGAEHATRTCCPSSPRASRPRRWPRWAPARSSRASWATCWTATSSCRTRTNCCTWPSPRPRPWPTPAGARRCKRLFPVAGRSGKATIQGQLVNMRDGGFISQHDFHIASLIANVVTGGDVDAGTLVSEEYLMTLERQAFCELVQHPKTQERILGMLRTGKPVRN